MAGIFVVGTDTGVGKSVIAGLLGRYLLEKGYRVTTQKWIQTGSKGLAADIKSHLRLMGLKRKDVKDYLPYISPYVFKFPSSPHLAAQLEKRSISAEKIRDCYGILSRYFDFVIVEGIGGALVPYDDKRLVIDIASELDLPAVIVVNNRLGAINTTLMTIESLRKRDMKIIGIVFNNAAAETHEIILDDNPRIINKLTGEKILGVLPWVKDQKALYKAFVTIGKRINAFL